MWTSTQSEVTPIDRLRVYDALTQAITSETSQIQDAFTIEKSQERQMNGKDRCVLRGSILSSNKTVYPGIFIC